MNGIEQKNNYILRTNIMEYFEENAMLKLIVTANKNYQERKEQERNLKNKIK